MPCPPDLRHWRLRPGAHAIAFEFAGQRQGSRVEGQAGGVRFVRFVRIKGPAWAWKSHHEWAVAPEAATRDRARRARLVADLERP